MNSAYYKMYNDIENSYAAIVNEENLQIESDIDYDEENVFYEEEDDEYFQECNKLWGKEFCKEIEEEKKEELNA